MSALIGLDVGTTGCKAVVFDEDGSLLAAASREYPVDLPHPSWAEQDIEAVWDLALASMEEAIAASEFRWVKEIVAPEDRINKTTFREYSLVKWLERNSSS